MATVSETEALSRNLGFQSLSIITMVKLRLEASIYSAFRGWPREEFPDLIWTVRGAVSIGGD